LRTSGIKTESEEYIPGVMFSTPLLLDLAILWADDMLDVLPTQEVTGLTITDPLLSRDLLEGIVAEGLALNGLRMLVKHLEGTLAFRRVNPAAWKRYNSIIGEKNKEDRRLSTLEPLPVDMLLKRENMVVPLNTIFKETPDRARKCDLIAVCMAPGTTTAYVIRAQVKMTSNRNSESYAASDAALLAKSWDTAIPKKIGRSEKASAVGSANGKSGTEK